MMLLLLAALLPSYSYASCPTLMGTFHCTRDGVAMPGEVSLATTSDSGFSSYDFEESASPNSDFSFIADGQQHPAPTNYFADGTSVARCPNGAAVVTMQGATSPSTLVTETWSFAVAGGGVNILLRDVIKPTSGPERVFTSRLVCR